MYFGHFTPNYLITPFNISTKNLKIGRVSSLDVPSLSELPFTPIIFGICHLVWAGVHFKDFMLPVEGVSPWQRNWPLRLMDVAPPLSLLAGSAFAGHDGSV